MADSRLRKILLQVRVSTETAHLRKVNLRVHKYMLIGYKQGDQPLFGIPFLVELLLQIWLVPDKL